MMTDWWVAWEDARDGTAVRDHVGKARWGCKSTLLIEHTVLVLRRLPGARLVTEPEAELARVYACLGEPLHEAAWWLSAQRAWLGVEARSLRQDRKVRLRWRREGLMRRIGMRLAVRGY